MMGGTGGGVTGAAATEDNQIENGVRAGGIHAGTLPRTTGSCTQKPSISPEKALAGRGGLLA